MTNSTDPNDDPLRTDEVIERILGDHEQHMEDFVDPSERDFSAAIIRRAVFLHLTGHTVSHCEHTTISWLGFHLPGSPRALQKPAPRAI